MTKKCISLLLILAVVLGLLTGCARTGGEEEPFGEGLLFQKTATDEEAFGDVETEQAPVYVDQVPILEEELVLEDEAVPMAALPTDTLLLPVASGTAVKTGGGAEIDYSNTADGYVMCRFAASNAKRLKVQVTGPNTTYTYDLPTGSWVTFPLSDGNGSYKTAVLQNTEGKKYGTLASVTFQVELSDEFAPFLRPNQYVDYSSAVNTIAKAKELTTDKGITQPLDQVKAVYEYAVGNLTYDKEKASTVKSGYLPVLDTVLAAKKGICFDYAALMTGMLRSLGVPCKLDMAVSGWSILLSQLQTLSL